jgi:hypothetical protein
MLFYFLNVNYFDRMVGRACGELGNAEPTTTVNDVVVDRLLDDMR